MITVRSSNARLVLVRILSPLTMDEVVQMEQEVIKAIRGMPGRFVGCVDLSAARVFRGDAAERILGLLRRDNAKLERSAFLLDPKSAILMLQFERMIREAQSPSRRTFRLLHEMLAWLGEVLCEEELSAAAQFLSEHVEKRPASS